MDSASDVSALLFNALCRDLQHSELSHLNRFDPYPSGIGSDLELTPREYAVRSLLCSIFKKSEVESDSDAEAKTLADFHAASDACKEFDPTTFESRDTNPAVAYSIEKARDVLYHMFNHCGDPAITMASIEGAARFGPGRSAKHGKRPTISYFKVGDAPHYGTSEFILSWYEISTRWHPLREAAELARKARHGPSTVHEYGQLALVPKSYSKRRIVVTEPCLNTYFQLGLGSEMERVLQQSTGISFATEPANNARLAQRGSLYGDYATMDLTQCSDYISLGLCEYMFPKSVSRWFRKLRTPYLTYQLDGINFTIEPGMTATMGNGFCFPMQTILLVACVLGVYHTLGIPPSSDGIRHYGVFGDDIVVDTNAFNLLSRVLTVLGLKVNASKSFAFGGFRESCGHDYFYGHDVRGIYLKRYTSDQDLLSCFNRLAQWSAVHDIDLSGTLIEILGLIKGVIPIIPPDEDVKSGLIFPNPPYGADEDGTWTYPCYTPTLSSLSIEPWEEYSTPVGPLIARRSKKFKRWVGDLKRYCDGSLNEPAVLSVMLQGGIRRNRMVFRSEEAIRYRLVKKSTPRWGWNLLEGLSVESLNFYRYDLLVKRVFAEWLTSLVGI